MEKTTKEVLHTQGEWIVYVRNEEILIEAIGIDGEETYAVNICKMHGNEEIDKNDAELIVTAVNSYHSLLDSLKWLLEAIPSQDNDHDWWPDELTTSVKNAKAIIAKINNR